MSKYNKMTVFERLYDKRNIYFALFSVNSYIVNKELLSEDDRNDLSQLSDCFDEENVNDWVEKVQQRLKSIIEGDSFLEAKVYFKPKKLEGSEVIFRPLHHACLLDQITAVAMLNVLIYEFDDDNQVGMSNLSRLIPHNFYGNRVAYDAEHLFIPWQEQYKKYTSKANECYKKYHETGDYKWEVSLDLRNFFPSINPIVLFRYIDDKLPVTLNEDERNMIRKILTKLIFVKIESLNEIDSKRYSTSKFEDIIYANGIAQGLPQSYFLANLLMIKIQQIYKKHLSGEMFFYVDDSVIFTNDITNKDDLNEKIKRINSDIEKWTREILRKKEYYLPSDLVKYVNDRQEEYNIKIHEPGDKSTASNIGESTESEIYLHCIGRETSKMTFDINTNKSDEENQILLNKTSKLHEAVERELESVKNEAQNLNDQDDIISYEAYKKKLIRYKKFFKYREIDLQLRTKKELSSISEPLVELLTRLQDSEREQALAVFFDNYSEDILGALINLVLSEEDAIGVPSDVLVEKVQWLNTLLFDEVNTTTSYLYRSFEHYWNDSKRTPDNDSNKKYHSLNEKLAGEKFVNRKKTDDVKREKVEILLKKTRTENLIVALYGQDYFDMVELVDANTNELKRRVINAWVSVVLGIEICDDVNLHKKGNRKITYTELRILEMLRYKKFDMKEFISKIDDFLQEEYNYPIDYSIFQVLSYFRTYVRDAQKIDNLILVHKYTCDIWKNGSKHLYFYTLHNQEHAVELIQNSVKILRAIDYIDISKFDYYVLFIACYLHDISMVTFPRLEAIQDDSFASNYLCSNFREQLELDNEVLEEKTLKKLLKDFYMKMDAFYENLVRSNHAKDSAKEIRTRIDLAFIDNALREIVAEVSEAHGYNTADVYNVKSDARNHTWSQKYTKIVLRLADLLDMSSYRVSKLVLNHNLNNMGEVSRFHWLSHLVTYGYKIDVEYNIVSKEDFLKKESMEEIITLCVDVCLPQFTKVKSKGCKQMKLEEASNNSIVLNCGETCDGGNCNFICKWFSEKNNYLFNELEALANYLNSVPNNYYKSKIKVIVRSRDNSLLSPEQFAMLDQYVNR